jgi:hypothetical protein
MDENKNSEKPVKVKRTKSGLHKKNHYFQLGTYRVNTWLMVISVFVISLFVFSISNNSITGSVVQAEETSQLVVSVVQDYLNDIDADFNYLKEEITLCSNDKVQMESVLKTAAQEFNACKIGFENIEAQNVELNGLLITLEKENVQLTSQQNEQLSNMQGTFETIISNAARTICCKERVDDSNINSFAIVSNQIECTSGGKTELEC